MLFYKSQYKGNFYKEVFVGNFTNELKLNNLNENNVNSSIQILAVSESNLEIYDYTYDTNLKIPFIEPNYNQELYFHILDTKVHTL